MKLLDISGPRKDKRQKYHNLLTNFIYGGGQVQTNILFFDFDVLSKCSDH